MLQRNRQSQIPSQLNHINSLNRTVDMDLINLDPESTHELEDNISVEVE